MKFFILIAGLWLSQIAHADFNQCVRGQGRIDKVVTDDVYDPKRPTAATQAEFEIVADYNSKMVMRPINGQMRGVIDGNQAMVDSEFLSRKLNKKGPFAIEVLSQDHSQAKGRHNVIVRLIENSEESKTNPQIFQLDLTREDHLSGVVKADDYSKLGSEYDNLRRAYNKQEGIEIEARALSKMAKPSQFAREELNLGINKGFGVTPENGGKIRFRSENMRSRLSDERIPEITITPTKEMYAGRQVYTGKGDKWYFQNGNLHSIPDGESEPITLLLNSAETFF